jgi:hypothetical protein
LAIVSRRPKPEGFEAYGVDLLAADIRGLIGDDVSPDLANVSVVIRPQGQRPRLIAGQSSTSEVVYARAC